MSYDWTPDERTPDWLAGYYEGYEPSALFERVAEPPLPTAAQMVDTIREWRTLAPAWFDEALRAIYAEEVV